MRARDPGWTCCGPFVGGEVWRRRLEIDDGCDGGIQGWHLLIRDFLSMKAFGQGLRWLQLSQKHQTDLESLKHY